VKLLTVLLMSALLQGCAVICAVIMPDQHREDQRQNRERVCLAGRISW
jgi:uncharacterized protein YceK